MEHKSYLYKIDEKLYTIFIDFLEDYCNTTYQNEFINNKYRDDLEQIYNSLSEYYLNFNNCSLKFEVTNRKKVEYILDRINSIINDEVKVI